MTATYEVALVIARGDRRRPVVATVTADATVADLASALGVSDAIYRFEQRLDPTAPLVDTGLVSGDVLGVGAPVIVGWRQLGHELRIIGGVDSGLRRRIDGAGLVLGRSDNADVVTRDRRLSRTHVEIRITDDGFEVNDLGSRNGVEVEGQAIDAHVSVPVPLGTAVRAGDTVFTVAAITDSGATLRRADPFHLAYTGGRPARLPDGPPQLQPPLKVDSSARRSVVPYVVPSAGALALAASASGAPVSLAFAATPAALIGAIAFDRVVQSRHSRRAEVAHAEATRRAHDSHRSELLGFALQARTAAPDPATLRAIVEHRGSRLWSSGPTELRVRLGLTADPVPLPYVVPVRREPLVVAGAAPALDALFVWLVAQAVALVSPQDLDVVVVTDNDDWLWTAWLPHRSELSLLPGNAVPSDLPQRRAPRRLVVLDRPSSSRWSIDPTLSADDLVLWRSDSESEVPYDASAVVSGASAVMLRVEDAHGVRDDVLADGLLDPAGFGRECALALARLHAPFGTHPDTLRPVSIVDVVPSLERVDDIVTSWRRAAGPLCAVIGVEQSGPLTVVLDGQNSHALIAGTTGSGKTRLLESLVISLAATRSPDELNVLIIDFKGGNELASLATLPHCVGMVSDRDASEVDRAISALTREIARRDELFASVGASDLADFGSITGDAPPKLVVIADEFGQFRRDDALGDRVATLLRIASQGRSKGLHLVLATQSPSTDVTPEIRQNVGVRICLRVAEPAESVAVLGVPDAARLSGPGHVIVGVDNEMRTGRVALAKVPLDAAPVSVRVDELADVARHRAAAAPASNRAAAAPASNGQLLHSLVASLRRAAEASGSSAPVLLPPPLPEQLTRRSLPHARRAWTAGGLVLAQRDRPGLADPPPFSFDPLRDATLTIVGGARSGRTTALLALAEAARDQAFDGSLVVHAIAWAHGLEQLDGTEGDGGVVLRGDYDHLRRTIAWLATPADDGVTRLVLVDRFDSLLRDVRDLDGGAFATRILEVLHDGLRHRIATVITTEPSALVTGGGGSLAGPRLVLPIDDPTLAIAAGLPRRVHSLPGRGAAANGDDVQVGLPAAVEPAAATTPGRVDRMPKVVPLRGLADLSGERIALGLGGAARIAPLVVDLDEVGPVIVVIGRAASGRSAALDAFADSYRGVRRVVAVGRTESVEWSPHDAPALLLVDDAVPATARNPWLADDDFPEKLRAGGHVAVVAFEQADLTGLGFRHWLTKRTFPGLLLALDATPDRIVAGERVGFLPPAELRAGPAGRGWWCWRGAGVPVQVAAN